MEEIWKDVKGYEGIYQVSNIGRVKSLLRKVAHIKGNRTIPERIIKLHISSSNGYYMVNLCKDKSHKSYLVHRLVAGAFISNPNKLPYINHKNEIRTDNRVENLEWCTPEYNIEYSRVREKSTIKTSKAVCQYDLDGNLIKMYDSMKEAGNAIGADPSCIAKCCNCEIGSVHGFIWKFKGDNREMERRIRKRRVIQKDLSGNTIKVWGSIKDAAIGTNSSVSGILLCCQGKRNKTSTNFKWSYYGKI